MSVEGQFFSSYTKMLRNAALQEPGARHLLASQAPTYLLITSNYYVMQTRSLLIMHARYVMQARENLERDTCWPGAWLAKEIPEARLLSIEYPAPASGWEVGQAATCFVVEPQGDPPPAYQHDY